MGKQYLTSIYDSPIHNLHTNTKNYIMAQPQEILIYPIIRIPTKNMCRLQCNHRRLAYSIAYNVTNDNIWRNHE